jgi:hypothetical protein
VESRRIAALALVGIGLLVGACSQGGRTPTAASSTAAPSAAWSPSVGPSETAVRRTPSATLGPSPVAASVTPAPTGKAPATQTELPTTASTGTPVPTTTVFPTVAAPTPVASTATPAPTVGSAPAVRSLVVSPDQPASWYAVLDQGLYRSSDRGSSWTIVSLRGIADTAKPSFVAIDYRNASVLYLGTSAGLYRRVRDGDWSFVHSYVFSALAVDLVDSNVLWGGLPYSAGLGTILVRSDDGGRTWGRADSGIPAGYGLSVGNIAIDPKDPDLLLVNVRDSGRFGWPMGTLYRGARNGYWQKVRLGQFEPLQSTFSDVCSVNGLAYDPVLRKLYVGCDQYYYNRGLLFMIQSTNVFAADAGAVQWEECHRFGQPSDYGLGAVRALAVDARDPSLLFASVSVSLFSTPSTDQILVSPDGGLTWADLPLGGIPR